VIRGRFGQAERTGSLHELRHDPVTPRYIGGRG
jgi:hypothetical protein